MKQVTKMEVRAARVKGRPRRWIRNIRHDIEVRFGGWRRPRQEKMEDDPKHRPGVLAGQGRLVDACYCLVPKIVYRRQCPQTVGFDQKREEV